MTRHDHRIQVYLRKGCFTEGNNAVDRAPVAGVNKGIARIVIDIAQMYRVVPSKDHRRIPSCVGCAKVHQINHLPVEVKLHLILKRHDRQRSWRIGLLIVRNTH